MSYLFSYLYNKGKAKALHLKKVIKYYILLGLVQTNSSIFPLLDLHIVGAATKGT